MKYCWHIILLNERYPLLFLPYFEEWKGLLNILLHELNKGYTDFEKCVFILSPISKLSKPVTFITSQQQQQRDYEVP